MVARKLTDEIILSTIDQLLSEGKEPTADGIVARAGFGNKGTALRGLNKWRDAKAAAGGAAPLIIPPQLQKLLAEFLKTEKLADRAERNARLAESERVCEDLANDNDRLKDALEQSNRECAALKEEIAGLSGKLAAVMEELRASQELVAKARQDTESALVKAATAEIRTQDFEKVQEVVEQLRNGLNAERGARTAAEQQAAVAKAHAHDAQTRAKDFRVQLERTQAAEEALQKDLRLERDEVRRLREVTSDLRVALEVAHATQTVRDPGPGQVPDGSAHS